MSQRKTISWYDQLQPLELYGEQVVYGPFVEDGNYKHLMPVFPYENANHGLGSPLLKMLGEWDEKWNNAQKIGPE
jgi:hypothetical protein